MMYDLLYRILPRDLMSRPFHINSFLPLYTYSSYRLQGHYVPLDYYLELEERLKSVSKQSRRFSLKG